MSHPIGEVRYGEGRTAVLHADGSWSAPGDPAAVTRLGVVLPPYGGPSDGPFGPKLLAEAAALLGGEAEVYRVADPAPDKVY